MHCSIKTQIYNTGPTHHIHYIAQYFKTVHLVVFHSNVSCMTSDQTEISITEQLYCYCCWHRHVDTLSAVKERERESTLAAWLHEKKNILDVESAQHTERNWPIISEMAREFLKCENVSWDIYRRQQINDKHINKTWSDDFFPFRFPKHTQTYTNAAERKLFLISKLLTQKLQTLSKSIRCVCLGFCVGFSMFICVCVQIPFFWNSDSKVGLCIINLCCLTFD